MNQATVCCPDMAKALWPGEKFEPSILQIESHNAHWGDKIRGFFVIEQRSAEVPDDADEDDDGGEFPFRELCTPGDDDYQSPRLRFCPWCGKELP